MTKKLTEDFKDIMQVFKDLGVRQEDVVQILEIGALTRLNMLVLQDRPIYEEDSIMLLEHSFINAMISYMMLKSQTEAGAAYVIAGTAMNALRSGR